MLLNRKTADATPKSNSRKLLPALIVGSCLIHGVVLLHVSGLYRSPVLHRIELTLQNLPRPKARHIPRPRPRPRPPEIRKTVKPVAAAVQPLPKLPPLPLPPVESDLPDTLAETIAPPDIGRLEGPPIADWGSGSQDSGGEFLTAENYFDMVRLRIERHKRYPALARKKNIEGRVTIRFVLMADGSVRDLVVVRAARNRLLNQAARDAVRKAVPFPRPPVVLFKGDLPLELTIVFELT